MIGMDVEKLDSKIRVEYSVFGLVSTNKYIELLSPFVTYVLLFSFLAICDICNSSIFFIVELTSIIPLSPKQINQNIFYIHFTLIHTHIKWDLYITITPLIIKI